jgi:hypothetical protein
MLIGTKRCLSKSQRVVILGTSFVENLDRVYAAIPKLFAC